VNGCNSGTEIHNTRVKIVSVFTEGMKKICLKSGKRCSTKEIYYSTKVAYGWLHVVMVVIMKISSS
jgi:hypothetical protein